MPNDLPEPPVPADTNVRDLDGFMLNTERLLASELWALSTGEEFKAAMGLWCRAWKQVPAGSLPDDERVLAAFSGAGQRWKKVREVALRGFVMCSDGRLYHGVLCEDVLRAAEKKAERRARTKAATEARKKKRDVDRNDFRDDERDDQRDDQRDVPQKPNVTRSQGQGQGQGQGQKEGKGRARAPADPKGSRLPEDWQPDDEEQAYAEQRNLDPERTADNFRGHWCAKAGKEARKVNWSLTWQNWCRREVEYQAERGGNGSGQAGLALVDPDEAEREMWRSRVKQYPQFQQNWRDLLRGDWGPPPDEAGCRAPPEILREFGYEPQPLPQRAKGAR